ncbi:MarR family transcriptional regulator [Paraburkholderia sp. A1RI-2L]|uniref:MarR family winged helix-turn-helix transcriptional regulator n=1 Tax=Paraburkholderia sp. A1RI-2L TaxID=3028367 RepID=UPI003B7FC45B
MAITAAPDQSLTYRLKALSKIADKKSGEVARDRLGLSYPEAIVLSVVGTFGQQTIRDISRRGNLDKGQASRTVESLIAQEMLTKSSNDADGRSVVIGLSADGRKIFKKVGPAMERRDKELYKGMEEEELLALRYLLDKALSINGWDES